MKNFLNSIEDVNDIKKIKVEDLPILANEIRSLILDRVSKNPGHLSSNLGIVELTIALHYCFDLKKDKIVWDVGHQTYTHKILTGRKEQFNTLREYDGLSGFPDREESPYDPFTCGHSGPAISSALGISCANKLLKKNDFSIAVVGDGGIGAGMSLEALNHAGDLKNNIIVVLNDNEMSISNTIGAVSKYLNNLRTTQAYSDIRRDFNELFNLIPSIGKPMDKTIEKAVDLVKKNVSLGQLFIQLGFNYFGPVDGHNFDDIIKNLKTIKKLKGPILLHTITKKGKGFEPASKDPRQFHSAGKFNTVSGLSEKKKGNKKEETWTDVFGKSIVKLAKKNKKIIGITSAMPDGTGLNEFANKFPDRFYDTGICEQHAIGLANGLSLKKFKPILAIYSTFLQRGYDQIFHDVCLQNNSVLFAIDRAGIVGNDGPTHNGCFDIAYLRHLPNITLMAPKNSTELEYMLEFASKMKTPAGIRYPREYVPNLKIKQTEIELGKGEVLKNGKDLVILAYGCMVERALDTWKILRDMKIDIGVVNARFVKPLDKDLMLKLAKDYKYIVTLEDHVLSGGFGSAVLEFFSEYNSSEPKIIRLGIPDEFVKHGPRDLILKKLGLDAQNISKTVLDIL